MQFRFNFQKWKTFLRQCKIVRGMWNEKWGDQTMDNEDETCWVQYYNNASWETPNQLTEFPFNNLEEKYHPFGPVRHVNSVPEQVLEERVETQNTKPQSFCTLWPRHTTTRSRHTINCIGLRVCAYSANVFCFSNEISLLSFDERGESSGLQSQQHDCVWK